MSIYPTVRYANKKDLLFEDLSAYNLGSLQ